MSNIKWLCSIAGKEAFAAAAAAVLPVPHVPLAAVRMLAAAGMRMTYAGVMAAAVQQLPGAEAWAHVCWPPQRMLSFEHVTTQLRSSFEMLQEAAEAAAAAAGVPTAVGAAVAAEQRAFMLLELLPHCAGSMHVCGSLLVLRLCIWAAAFGAFKSHYFLIIAFCNRLSFLISIAKVQPVDSGYGQKPSLLQQHSSYNAQTAADTLPAWLFARLFACRDQTFPGCCCLCTLHIHQMRCVWQSTSEMQQQPQDLSGTSPTAVSSCQTGHCFSLSKN
jgi:hypothetical protein